MKKLKAISLFSGCGGFDFGATQAGVEFIWANDIDPIAATAYRSILPDVDFHFGDISKVDSFPRADVLVGCYPCTGFSIGARRKAPGQAERDLLSIKGNFLYLEFLRALEQSKAKYFFVENVRGMLSANEGWFFQQQLIGFQEKGYTVYHKMLFAPDYGLPQARQRVFIVGVRNDIAENFKYEFMAATHGPQTSQPYTTLKDAITDMPLWPKGEFSENKFHGHYLTRNRKRHWNEQSFTIVANASHVPLHPHGSPMTFVKKDTWKLNGDFNRRLSWRECALLQGLPDNLKPGGNLDGHYRVIGNAVPPIFGKVLLTPVVKYENT